MRQSDITEKVSVAVICAHILGGLRLLSRLPLPQSEDNPGPAAAWAWPVTGVVVGSLVAGVAALCLPLGAQAAAAIALGAQAMITGAMHEDGLADSADGLWGGWDRARRLDIMKDSHIGTYGVMALLVVALIRWSALTTLISGGHWGAIVAVAVFSRAPMAVLMWAMENARGTGLAQSVGRVPGRAAAGAAALGGVALLMLGVPGLAAGVAGIGVVCVLALVARAKIGGQTGDILGASQQLAEAAALCVLAAVLH